MQMNCSRDGVSNLTLQRKIMTLSAVIWDLDGTIIDSAPDLAGTLNTLLQAHRRPPLSEADVRGMIGNGVARLIERGFAESRAIESEDELRHLVAQFMSDYNARATVLTRIYPGARVALREFLNAGILQAICTNKPEAISRTILKDLDLDQYFEIVVGGDTLEHRKPHPLPLRSCLQALGANTESALMIGDSAVDVATARALSMTVGIVTHGYARQPVETLGADFLISDLARLSTQVDQMLRISQASA